LGVPDLQSKLAPFSFGASLGPIMKPDQTSTNDDKPDLLDAAVQIWREAQVVHNPGRKGETPSEAMVRTIADEIGKYRERLMECLSHGPQLVAAYALLVLRKVNDPALKELPTELLTSHKKITVRTGSFSETMELGAFARMLRKEAWRRGRNIA
jgi:hypothetical protein